MRTLYHERLEDIVAALVSMTDQVQASVSRATRALLTADTLLAEQVVAADEGIDAYRERIEDQVVELMALQQPVAGDLRTLLAAVRMVGDLERMGDLSVHVAKITRLRAPSVAVPEELRPIVERMGHVAEHMVGAASRVIAERDVEAAQQLEEDDEEMDELRRQSFRIMLGDGWAHGVEPAVDVALIGRYYERIADHAVGLARRVVYLVTGRTSAFSEA